ncbi:MAG TPA: hypothetical protein VF519_06750 [Mycobacteriales bacterium]|jgi:hypothetical protein
MSPLVQVVTRDELETRRAEIEAAIGMTAAELRTLDETRTLTPEQRYALADLNEIEFLLGDS